MKFEECKNLLRGLDVLLTDHNMQLIHTVIERERKAALQEAARELGPWLKHDRLCRVDGCVCGLEQKIMQLGEG